MADPEIPYNNNLQSHRDARYKEVVFVTVVGSVVDLALGISKIVVGIISHSQALVADGIHSLSDLATDFMVLYAAKHASREADETHPYGHGRIETAATVALGVALIAVAIGIAFNALQDVIHPADLKNPGVMALVIAGLSIISKEVIYHYTMHAARKYRSDLLKANAWHSRSDAISSVVVVIGIVGTMAGYEYLDALAAVVVAAMIARIGWQLAWNSVRELVDTALDKEQVKKIEAMIKSVEGVESMHQLRSRRMGGDALVDVHIQVAPKVSVSEGHQISESVRFKLLREIDEVSDVTVHIDPEDDEIGTACCALPLRKTISGRMNERFRHIEQAKHIKHVTLHYIGGKIHVEIELPLNVLHNLTDATDLSRQFQDAIHDDKDIGSIKLLFS
ncbi:MAG: cation diffusion facilitator family transporter [Gammaproteobacteria bacterium]|nr:cation diffusion facilitator family transporter [Gammaproteobacteria bacterium]